MARPRPVIPGRIYLLTRRCSERRFLLRPGEKTNQAINYCLAEAAQRFDMDVLWMMACSNHIHLGIHDRHGNYPAFIAHLHKMTAKVLNAHWGRWECLWAAEQTSVVHLADADAVFDKLIYSLTNPVKDDLVDRAVNWPGTSSLGYQLRGQQLVVRRPRWFFAKGTEMPDVVRLTFKRPEPFASLSHKQWVEKLRAAIEMREREAAAERKASGGRVLGRKAVLRQSAFDSPQSHEPRRQMSPRVATRNKWRRIEALQRNVEFLRAYAAALEAYQAGKAAAAFPAGTYKLYEDGHVFRDAA